MSRKMFLSNPGDSWYGVEMSRVEEERQQRRRDNALISCYLKCEDDIDWFTQHYALSTALLNTGHSVEIINTELSDVSRVSVGKLGLAITGTGELLSEAMCKATVAFIKFLGKVQGVEGITRSKQNLPMQAAR